MQQVQRSETMSPNFPDTGILWRIWNDDTRREIAQRKWPVLLFVVDQRPVIWPQLKQILEGMPANTRLRELLGKHYPALLIEASNLPAELEALGAGSRYHIAVLSPFGLTPMATIDPVSGTPEEIINEIVLILERLVKAWRL